LGQLTSNAVQSERAIDNGIIKGAGLQGATYFSEIKKTPALNS
jgi:hypothetical protein